MYGILTSHGGNDFAAVGSAFTDLGYKFGALVLDAKMFVPQSRPRIFIIGVDSGVVFPPGVASEAPLQPWHVDALVSAYAKLSSAAKNHWVWWALPPPFVRQATLSDVVEETPSGVAWHSIAETERLLSMMSSANLKRVELARKTGKRFVGGVYRRTRKDEEGRKVQRAEVRFDNIAGCLRTPSGGSSRQLILLIENKKIRSRLLSPREAARLMGLPDTYVLPTNYNEAYHLCGDGVVAPVVRFLAANLLEPLIDHNRNQAVLPLRVA